MAAETATFSERNAGRMGITDAAVRPRVNLIRHAGAFAADHQNVARLEPERRVGNRTARGQQNEPRTLHPTIGVERRPGDVAAGS